MLIAIALISLVKLLRMKHATDKLILVQKENYLRSKVSAGLRSK